jgi:TolB-like protein/class 3 adenylate cyclase
LQPEQRRLAAILAADVAGYSRLMAADELGTMAQLKRFRTEVIEPKIAQFQGRIVGSAGDSLLVEFASALNAVQCAVEVQVGLADQNANLPEDRRMAFRMGVNLGDVIPEDDTIHGDGVNIAARLEKLAEPGSVCIARNVYDQVKGKLAYAYADLGEQRLHNIPEPVRAYRVKPSKSSADTSPGLSTKDALPLPDKPSIAVLPFENMSSDPEQEYFADGLTEDIITALSRVSSLFVIARTSTFTYKGQPTDVKRVAKELGVRYVMEGSARRAGDRLRITAQLIDAIVGHHVWADQYDRSVADIFDIQDEITHGVAASVVTHVHLAERQAAALRPSIDLKARDLVTLAMGRLYDLTSDAFADVADLAEQALRLEPMYPRAHLMRAAAFLHRLSMGEVPHDPENVARGIDLAQTAARLAPRDEYSHWMMAFAYAEAGRLEDAVVECELGLAVNPNWSALLADMGDYLAFLGRSNEAIEVCRLALRLNPRDPSNFWRHSSIATAHFVAADYGDALEKGKRVARWHPNFLRGAIVWAAAAAALDRMDEARVAVACCLAQRSDLRVRNIVPHFMMRFARDDDHERLLAMLRKAGLPE